MTIQVSEKIPLITLVGPPNSGKTTLFNYLSGKNFKTVNYPGATVEFSVSKLLDKYKINANLLDSPGIISLVPNSPDEKVAVNSLYSHPQYGIPDVVVATADASQLSRHLLLINQLIECGFKVVVAITMHDILERKGYKLSIKSLSDELGCRVIKVDGRNGNGVSDLLSAVKEELEEAENDDNKIIPSFFDTSVGLEKLISSYKNIEKIEQNVLFPYSGNGNGINIDAANEKLVVLNDLSIKKITHKPDENTLKIDRFLLHRTWGIISFFVIMSLTFTSIFWLADPLMKLVDDLFGLLSSAAIDIFGYTWLGDFLANGVISGTGAVMVFVPQIMILFLILGLLEDTGYLARGAMLIDKPLSKIGLNGKSFVPMLSGFACAIPAMLATRTIPNKRERLLTIFIIPLMSCSARIPVYALLIAFLLPADKLWMGGLLLAAIYIFSTSSSLIVAGIVNKFKNKIINEEDSSSFILELPAYRRPKLSVVLNNTYNSSKVYVKKAGPIILAFSVILWFLTYFPNSNPQINTAGLTQEEIVQTQKAERLQHSYAADIGKIIQPVMTPIRMDWRVGVALMSAFAAREVFVSSMALIFKVTSNDENLQASILNAMRSAEIDGTGQKLFTTSTIIGLIVYFIFALQCISTIAVSRKETGGWRIPILQILIFTSTAYFLTFLTVHGLRALGVS